MRLLAEVLASVIAAVVIAVVAGLSRNRAHLSVLRLLLLGSRPVRVSVSVLLRVQDDDSYVMVHTPHTPGSFGPPGGVVKYRRSARPVLDALGFREERCPQRAAVMRHDLRGFLAARSVPAFIRWLEQGSDRETAVECLGRELAEELGEVGHELSAPAVASLCFVHVRTVVEPLRRVQGRPYRQFRRFEVWDLALTGAASVWLRDRLLEWARDETRPLVALATGQNIIDGRVGDSFVGPQAAFLFGSRRYRADLPPVH